MAVSLFQTCYLSLFWADFQNPPGLIAVGSDHLCAVQGDWLLIEEREQLGGVRLPANRSVTTPLYEGLREVGNGTRVALALILKLSLAQRKLQAPIVTSWLHRFILMRETVLILQPSWAMTKLPGLTCMRAVVNWASVACLANSRTPADFFCFVFFHIILTEPLETFKSLCSVCCGFWTKGRHKKGYHCAFSVLLWSRSTLFLHLLTVQAAQFYARARRRGPAIYLANHLIYGN